MLLTEIAMPVSRTNIEFQAALLAVSLFLSLCPAASAEETSEAISQTADLVDKTNLEELGFKEYRPGKVEQGAKPNQAQKTEQSPKPIWVQKADAASKLDCSKKQPPQQKTNSDEKADLGQKADFVGKAAWYSSDLHGKKTASGQPYDESKMTAAHKQLPFGTKVTVVNRKNGKTCTLTINDRGPFVPNHVIDVSKAAAKELGLMSDNKRLVDCYIRIDAKDLIKKQQQNKVKVAAKPEAETL